MKQRRSLLVVGVILVLLAGAAASAEGDDAQSDEQVRLTLAECLRTALENNLDLVVARKDPEIAELGIEVSQAEFDPTLGASASIDRLSEDETFTDLNTGVKTDDSSDTDVMSGSASLSQKLKYGGSYMVTANNRDTDPSPSLSIDSTTGFLTQTDVDLQNRGLTLNYEQSLLRGRGTEVNTFDILVARYRLEMSQQDLRLQAHDTLKRVEDAYWDLVAARKALEVSRESLTLARDLYELNRKKVEVGTLAPIEITQAEAGVASREEGVIVAENVVANAEDELRRLLAFPKDDPAWFQEIVPTDLPEFRSITLDLDVALEEAMRLRPEIITARKELRERELSERVAHNSVKHDLTLEASLSTNADDTDLSVEIIEPPGIPTSVFQIERDGFDWSIGLTYAYPIRNRAAKANYAISKLNREKSEASLHNLEQSIRVDVRTAARNVGSGVKRVAAAQASTVLQRKTLEAEQKKFENGMSTSFEVLRIQTDLSDARLAEIRAVLDYIKALADYERAKGTLLEARNLRLE